MKKEYSLRIHFSKYRRILCCSSRPWKSSKNAKLSPKKEINEPLPWITELIQVPRREWLWSSSSVGECEPACRGEAATDGRSPYITLDAYIPLLLFIFAFCLHLHPCFLTLVVRPHALTHRCVRIVTAVPFPVSRWVCFACTHFLLLFVLVVLLRKLGFRSSGFCAPETLAGRRLHARACLVAWAIGREDGGYEARVLLVNSLVLCAAARKRNGLETLVRAFVALVLVSGKEWLVLGLEVAWRSCRERDYGLVGVSVRGFDILSIVLWTCSGWCAEDFVCGGLADWRECGLVAAVSQWLVLSKQRESRREERLRGSSLPRRWEGGWLGRGVGEGFGGAKRCVTSLRFEVLTIWLAWHCVQAARKSAPTTGGVKKPHRYRPGTVALR